eukprot:2773289-Pleurochrysis_carterae.AAC.2
MQQRAHARSREGARSQSKCEGLRVFCCTGVRKLRTHVPLVLVTAALRLQVEFQNKFYKGDGRKFIPFSFADELAADAADF